MVEFSVACGELCQAFLKTDTPLLAAGEQSWTITETTQYECSAQVGLA